MRTDYFDDLLPEGVTPVTQPKKPYVTPTPRKISLQNKAGQPVSHSSRPLRPKSENLEHSDEIREQLEERAAIQEFDGGLARRDAERAARSSLRVYRYRLTDHPEAELIFLSPGSTLDEAINRLRLRFGERLLDVTESKVGNDD